jgi:hypothetical protein
MPYNSVAWIPRQRKSHSDYARCAFLRCIPLGWLPTARTLEAVPPVAVLARSRPTWRPQAPPTTCRSGGYASPISPPRVKFATPIYHRPNSPFPRGRFDFGLGGDNLSVTGCKRPRCRDQHLSAAEPRFADARISPGSFASTGAGWGAVHVGYSWFCVLDCVAQEPTASEVGRSSHSSRGGRPQWRACPDPWQAIHRPVGFGRGRGECGIARFHSRICGNRPWSTTS